jgi:hypothetical protein
MAGAAATGAVVSTDELIAAWSITRIRKLRKRRQIMVRTT